MKKSIFTPIKEYEEKRRKNDKKTFTKFKPKNPSVTITSPDRHNERICVRKLNWDYFEK